MASTAAERIIQFSEKDRGYRDFLALAALPLLFSTDLLYQLWANFKAYKHKKPKLQAKSLVVSDLILSGLCRSIGHNLFRLDDEVRNALLTEVPSETKEEVAQFLQEFAQHHKAKLGKNIYEAHSLWAKGVLQPKEMEQEIIDKLQSKIPDQQKVNYLSLYYNLLPNKTGTNEGTNITLEIADHDEKEDNVLRAVLPLSLRERVALKASEVGGGKPAAILRLEKELGITIEQVDLGDLDSVRCVYAVNAANQVVHLAINQTKLDHLSFLQDFPELDALFLCANRLTRVSDIPLLKRLKLIDLHGNEIKSIDPVFFNSLPQLTYLALGYNHISNLSITQTHEQLKNLELGHNRLMEFNASFLEYFPQLLALNLSNNPFHYIPKSITAQENCLPDLKAYFNQEEWQEDEPDAIRLIEENLRTQNPRLDLGNCDLDGTENEIFALLESAEHLEELILANAWRDKEDLSGSRWPKEYKSENVGLLNAFIQLPKFFPPNLKRLILAGDISRDWDWEIEDFSPLADLKQLEYLDLSNCSLREIPNKAFKNLQTLVLTSNHIRYVPANFLQLYPKLNKLYLNSNRIRNRELSRFTNIDGNCFPAVELYRTIYPYLEHWCRVFKVAVPDFNGESFESFRLMGGSTGIAMFNPSTLKMEWSGKMSWSSQFKDWEKSYFLQEGNIESKPTRDLIESFLLEYHKQLTNRKNQNSRIKNWGFEQLENRAVLAATKTYGQTDIRYLIKPLYLPQLNRELMNRAYEQVWEAVAEEEGTFVPIIILHTTASKEEVSKLSQASFHTKGTLTITQNPSFAAHEWHEQLNSGLKALDELFLGATNNREVVKNYFSTLYNYNFNDVELNSFINILSSKRLKSGSLFSRLNQRSRFDSITKLHTSVNQARSFLTWFNSFYVYPSIVRTPIDLVLVSLGFIHRDFRSHYEFEKDVLHAYYEFVILATQKKHDLFIASHIKDMKLLKLLELTFGKLNISYKLSVNIDAYDTIYELVSSTDYCLMLISHSYLSEKRSEHKQVLQSIRDRVVDSQKRQPYTKEYKVLPLWHKVTRQEVIKELSPFANIFAVQSNEGLLHIIQKITEVVKPEINFETLQLPILQLLLKHIQDLISQGKLEEALESLLIFFGENDENYEAVEIVAKNYRKLSSNKTSSLNSLGIWSETEQFLTELIDEMLQYPNTTISSSMSAKWRAEPSEEAMYYHIPNITTLLQASFKEIDFNVFVTVYFEEAQQQFSPKQSLHEQMDFLISYCQRTNRLGELLSRVEKERPTEFRKLGPYIDDDGASFMT